jgi:F0F1-type ATP synthase assembly protein I
LPARSTPPDRESEGDDQGRTSALRQAAPLVGIGLTLALTVLAGLGGGYWLDRRFATHPVFLLLGAALGVGAALYHFFKVVAELNTRHSSPKR